MVRYGCESDMLRMGMQYPKSLPIEQIRKSRVFGPGFQGRVEVSKMPLYSQVQKERSITRFASFDDSGTSRL